MSPPRMKDVFSLLNEASSQRPRNVAIRIPAEVARLVTGLSTGRRLPLNRAFRVLIMAGLQVAQERRLPAPVTQARWPYQHGRVTQILYLHPSEWEQIDAWVAGSHSPSAGQRKGEEERGPPSVTDLLSFLLKLGLEAIGEG